MELQRRVAQLELENQRLQDERTYTVERFVEVPPPDYQELKNKCCAMSEDVESLQNRCKMLEHILCYSEISPMSQIIRDYKSMSTFYLQYLTKEINFYRLSRCERLELLNFLEYLHSVTRDVEEMERRVGSTHTTIASYIRRFQNQFCQQIPA